MKPIFTCFSVCQGAHELLLLGRKENSQGMKFSTLSSRPAMVRICTHFFLAGVSGTKPLWLVLRRLKPGLSFTSKSCAMNTSFGVSSVLGVVWH